MMVPAELEIVCGNCDRPWLDRDERWRCYLDDESSLVVFCPDCASREFEPGGRGRVTSGPDGDPNAQALTRSGPR